LLATAVQGRSRADVATAMGVSEGSVRQLVHRARMSMRTAVTALTPAPLARWMGLVDSPGPDRLPEIASAGALSGGGIAVKLVALIASGVIGAGVVASAPREHAAAHRRVASARPSAEVPHRPLARARRVDAVKPGTARAGLTVATGSPRASGGSERRHQKLTSSSSGQGAGAPVDRTTFTAPTSAAKGTEPRDGSEGGGHGDDGSSGGPGPGSGSATSPSSGDGSGRGGGSGSGDGSGSSGGPGPSGGSVSSGSSDSSGGPGPSGGSVSSGSSDSSRGSGSSGGSGSSDDSTSGGGSRSSGGSGSSGGSDGGSGSGDGPGPSASDGSGKSGA
jgi:hypothetical protein